MKHDIPANNSVFYQNSFLQIHEISGQYYERMSGAGLQTRSEMYVSELKS